MSYLGIDFDYIDIVYENCDCVRIPADMIERMHIIDLTQTLNSYEHGKAGYNYSCKRVEMELNEEAGNLITINDAEYGEKNPTPFFEHVKNTPSTTHIAICKGEDTLLYISVPYTDIGGMSYCNYYEKVVTDSIWDKKVVYSIDKRNLRGVALWKYLKMEVRLFPHNYFFKRIKVRIENYFYDRRKTIKK